jgi:hypothetical protein
VADVQNMQLQQMMTMLAAQHGAHAAQATYQPRFVSPTIAAQPGFSFAQTGQQVLGEGGAMLGAMADMLLPQVMGSQYTTFMTSLNMARSNDYGAFAAQQRMQNLMGSLATHDVSRITASAATQLGLSPEFAQGISQFVPLLDMMSGGAITDIARLADPALMTQRGAAGIVAAQRRLETMGRLDEARATRMQRQLRERGRLDASGRTLFDARLEDPELSEDGFRLRNNAMTAGFNLDEFSDLMFAAADMGLRDRRAGRSAADIQRFRALAARDNPNATPEQIEASVRTQQDDAALISAASNLAQVTRTLQSLAPEMGAGQLANLAQNMGFVPGRAEDVSQIQEVIRQLKALGDAAGMSSEQMLQAGMTLQRQFGGSLSFNMAVAGSAQSMQRFFGDRAADAGQVLNRGLMDQFSSDTAEAVLATQQAMLGGLQAFALTSEEYRDDYLAAASQGPEATAAFLMRLSQDTRAQSAAMEMSGAAVNAAHSFMGNRFGATFMTEVGLRAAAEERNAYIRALPRMILSGSEDAVDISGFFTNLDQLDDDAFSLFVRAMNDPQGLGALTEEERLTANTASERFGLTAGQAVEAAARNPMLRVVMGFQASMMTNRLTAADRRRAIEEGNISEILSTGMLNPRGLERILTDLRDPNSDVLGMLGTRDGFLGGLERLGFLVPEGERGLLNQAFGGEGADAARGEILRGLQTMLNPNASAEEQAAAKATLGRYGMRDTTVPSRGGGTAAAEPTVNLERVTGALSDTFERLITGLGGLLDRISGGGSGNASAPTAGDPDTRTARVRLEIETPNGVLVSQIGSGSGIEVVNASTSRGVG